MLWTECFQLDTLPCLIASFKLEPLFKHSGCKHSNISGCQKFKYFRLSKTQIFLVVKNSNISGCQNWKDNLHISSFLLSPTTVRETTSSRVCPLFLVVLQWSLNGPGWSFVLYRIYDLPFDIVISCHPEEEVFLVLFKIIGAINEITPRRKTSTTLIIKMASESTFGQVFVDPE